jgi:hypothetical protein
MDINTLECNKDDSTLFQIIDEVQFYEYPHCSGVGYSDFSLMSGDTVVMKAQFHVKQGTTLEPVVLDQIIASIVAVKQNGTEEFPLETFALNTAGFLPNCSNIQEIDFADERDFIVPTNDCRVDIRLFRMPTLDIAGYSAYEFIYPFKVRWEEWRQLQGANRCFPTATQNWVVYAGLTGWSIKFSIKAAVTQTTVTTRIGQQWSYKTTNNFEHIVWGEIKDDCEIPYSVEFITSDPTGVNTYEEVIAKDTDTLVTATIKGDFTGYAVEQLYGILTLDAWGIGGITYSQEIGTHIDVDDNFVWYGLPATPLKATLTKVSNNTLTVMAFINYEYLPKDTNQFILSARVGEYRESSSSSGAGCMNEITLVTFTCGELQIIEAVDANTIIVSGEVVTSESRDVFADSLTLTYVAASGLPGTPLYVAAHWTVLGGTIGGYPISSGTITGNVIAFPAHPYTNTNVGDMIQGELTGSIYTSIIPITGIGDMQIGCTFFVS